jgi:hypothetical protein
MVEWLNRFDSIGGSSARLASRMMPMTKMNTSPVTKLRSVKICGSMKVSRAVARWTTNTQKPVSARPSSIQISGAENQSTSPPRSSISCSAPTPSDSMAKPKKSKPRRRLRDLRQIGGTAEEGDDADRQVDEEHPAPVEASVSQPPSVGPMIGPTMMPAPHMAMAWPWRSFGLMSSRKVCDSGTIAAPKTPCSSRKSTIVSRLQAIPQSHRGDRETDHRDEEQFLAAEAVGQPARQRRHDRRGDNVGGQHPVDRVAARHRDRPSSTAARRWRSWCRAPA